MGCLVYPGFWALLGLRLADGLVAMGLRIFSSFSYFGFMFCQIGVIFVMCQEVHRPRGW